MLRTIRHLLEMIRFSHTLFALPFALLAAVMAWRTPLPGSELPPAFRWQELAGILVCMVGARSAAMAFNRLVDRRFDATNARTRERASVTGRVSPRTLAVAVLGFSAGFVASAFLLNPLCGLLSFAALAVILGYSYAKRVTSLSHFVLGAALGLAPIGAYLAVTGGLGPAAPGVWFVSAAVLFWTAGFDVLYSCQDLEHDRREGLHSIPASAWRYTRC